MKKRKCVAYKMTPAGLRCADFEYVDVEGVIEPANEVGELEGRYRRCVEYFRGPSGLKRCKRYAPVLSGSDLGIWDSIEGLLPSTSEALDMAKAMGTGAVVFGLLSRLDEAIENKWARALVKLGVALVGGKYLKEYDESAGMGLLVGAGISGVRDIYNQIMAVAEGEEEGEGEGNEVSGIEILEPEKPSLSVEGIEVLEPARYLETEVL